MKRKLACFVFVALFVGWLSPGVEPLAQAADGRSQDSGRYGHVLLPRPSGQESLDYLGLTSEAPTFTLAEVNADIFIVEVFSAECRKCLRLAPEIQKLFELVEEKGLSDKVKLVGFGIGNTGPEMTGFQKRFQVGFPLVADADFKIFRLVGRVEIPHVAAFQRDKEGRFKQIYVSLARESHAGRALLDKILQAAGL